VSTAASLRKLVVIVHAAMANASKSQENACTDMLLCHVSQVMTACNHAFKVAAAA